MSDYDRLLGGIKVLECDGLPQGAFLLRSETEVLAHLPDGRLVKGKLNNPAAHAYDFESIEVL